MINTISIKKGCSITTDIVECDYNNGKEILIKEAKSLYSDTFEEYTQLSLFDNDIKTIYSTQTDSSYYECEPCNYNVIKSVEETNVIISYENNIIKLQHKRID